MTTYSAISRYDMSLQTDDYAMAELRDGLRFWTNLRDYYVSEGIRTGIWEESETAFVKRAVKRGMNVVDVGANLGWYTVHLSRLVGNDGSVVAFEPRNDLHHYLCKTVAANNLSNTRSTILHWA